VKKRKVHALRPSISHHWHLVSQPKKTKKPTSAEPASVLKTVAQDVSTTQDTAKQNRTTTSVPVKNEKKALKKARAREKKAANDELDQALAELSIQYGSMSSVPPNLA
jgi:hypothetical protein